MILKDLDPFNGGDKFAVAGRRAEEQMAHYLKRFFGGSQEVDVLNYLRIALDGEIAQMDHLVVHPFGLTIVESKSVSGSIQIKDDGQWVRWYDKRPQGVRSPVTQARMQAMLLRDLLTRTVKQKGFFDSVELDVLVAISDSGTIQWPSTGVISEVCKADQVPERIHQKIIQEKESCRTEVLPAQHRKAVTDFLKLIHQPLLVEKEKEHDEQERRVSESFPPADPMASVGMDTHFGRGPQLPLKVCKACGGKDLLAQYGKYGYYFSCKTCGINTAIKFPCPSCGEEGRVRKQGKDFFAECRSCDASVLYHSNE